MACMEVFFRASPDTVNIWRPDLPSRLSKRLVSGDDQALSFWPRFAMPECLVKHAQLI